MAAYCFSCELGLRANSPGRSGGGGGKRKESTSFSGIRISASKKSMRNADWRRWHKLWRHFPWHVFFNACLHSRSFPLRADWRKFDSSVNGEPQGNWRWNSNSRIVVARSPSFFRPAARARWRTCSQAREDGRKRRFSNTMMSYSIQRLPC